MDELISYLLGAPSLFDPILWVILLLSALTGFGIFWSKAKQLGVQYGEKNHLKSVWKTCFLTVFFISELIAVIRARFAAIRFAGRSSSVWMFFPVFILYFSVLMLSIFVGSKVQRRMVRQWGKKHESEINDITNANPIYQSCLQLWNNSQSMSAVVLYDRVLLISEKIDDIFSGAHSSTTPVNSQHESKQCADAKIVEWKRRWIFDFFKQHIIDYSVIYSDLGYSEMKELSPDCTMLIGERYDLSSIQLAEALRRAFSEKSGSNYLVRQIQTSASHSYKRTYSGFRGRGETFEAVSETKSFSATSYGTVAFIIYPDDAAPNPTVASQSQKSPLNQW